MIDSPHSVPRVDTYRDDEQTGVFTLVREFTIVRCYHCPDYVGDQRENGQIGDCFSKRRKYSDGQREVVGFHVPLEWCPHRKENR